MAASVRFLLGRAAETALNKTMNGNHTTPATTQSAPNRTIGADATAKLISQLVFAESKSVRTSTIILAAFNVLAAFATAISILYDCYWSSRRCNAKFKTTKFCMSSMHPGETFPLVLAVGIVIQGLVFAGVSGEGLESLFTSGCTVIAQFMWPALFIVPYLQLVFGAECALRSLRKFPFQARGKYDVAICCGVVVLMLILTWLPSHLIPQPDVCFASLVWFVTRYGQLGLRLLSVTAGLMTLSAIIIFVRLSTVSLIDEHQRIAASRMVYYLVLGIVSLAFVIPFFGSLIQGQGDIKLSMMATVVLNLSGLMSGLLQLFLRSNTAATSFGSKQGRQWDRKKHQIRIFGPNELAMHNHLVDPVTGPVTPRELESRATSRASLVGPEKGRVISMDSLDSAPTNPFSPKRFDEISDMPSMPEAAAGSKSGRGHSRKPSYSLFPTEGSSPTKSMQQPTSVYSISDLAPPPVIHYAGGSRHRRDSSIASSATVQIGLRISHAPSPSREDMNALPLPSSTYKSRAPSPTKLQTSTLPSTSYGAPPLPSTTYSAVSTSTFAVPAPRPAPPPSPLKFQTNATTTPSSSLPPRSPRLPTPLNTTITRSPSTSPTRPFINKTLPPTPKASIAPVDIAATATAPARQSTCQLTPAVYSPEKKIKTSGLVRVGGAPMSATLPNSNPLRGNPLGSPITPPKRSNSGRTPMSQQQAKADWI